MSTNRYNDPCDCDDDWRCWMCRTRSITCQQCLKLDFPHDDIQCQKCRQVLVYCRMCWHGINQQYGSICHKCAIKGLKHSPTMDAIHRRNLKLGVPLTTPPYKT